MMRRSKCSLQSAGPRSHPIVGTLNALVCMRVCIFLSQNIILDYNNNDTSNLSSLFIVRVKEVGGALEINVTFILGFPVQSKLDARARAPTKGSWVGTVAEQQ